jgi:glycine/D-amino acid oxidase-like deaminating enzyme
MAAPNLNTFAPAHEKHRAYQIPISGKNDRIVIVGAGSFGGWSALYLLRKGFDVTLLDAWGPGNSRSSSGDETRVIRSTYGANEHYFDLNVRALELWKENQERFGRQLFFNSGVIWFCYDQHTPLVDDSIAFAEKHQQTYEYLSVNEISRRYPHVNTSDLHHAYLDPFGGYLKARESCQYVVDAYIREGGRYSQSHVAPVKMQSGKMTSLMLSDGSYVEGDVFLFACGSWLGKLFPDLLKSTITCTRQEAYYFGVPHAHAKTFDNMPVWIDVDGKDFYYGIPGNAYRGFKLGVDERGAPFDPDSGDRILNEQVLSKARRFIAHRFPELKDAPLVESRVCPYENSPDGNFVFDKHPEADNVLFLGGGSGHGFKHGPALGELVANVLAGEKQAPLLFQLPINN